MFSTSTGITYKSEAFQSISRQADIFYNSNRCQHKTSLEGCSRGCLFSLWGATDLKLKLICLTPSLLKTKPKQTKQHPTKFKKIEFE